MPEQQICSHFEYFRRWHGYQKSFIEFVQEPRFIIFQSKQLSVVPISSIGFIGLTEKYDESIDLINKKYGLSIPIEHLNKNEEKFHHQYKLFYEEFDLIKKLN